MFGPNFRYESIYKLHTINGVTAFLKDYSKLAEARFYSSNLDLADLLLDFDLAYKRSLTARQQEVIGLTFFQDLRQEDVASELGLTQQTVQEHIQKAIKNLATYHLLEQRRAGD